MGVEGCTKCIKYILFVFNFIFWVSRGAVQGREAGGRLSHPSAFSKGAPIWLAYLCLVLTSFPPTFAQC